MKRKSLTRAVLIPLVIVAGFQGAWQAAAGAAQTAEPQGRSVPMFEVDTSWPKVPAKWKLGDVSSIAIDAQGHDLLILNLGSITAFGTGIGAVSLGTAATNAVLDNRAFIHGQDIGANDYATAGGNTILNSGTIEGADIGIFIHTAAGKFTTVNGNVSSGAIGILQGQTAAFLPQSYGDVYGTGIDWRVGGGYTLDDKSEVRGMFIWQSADADLVRLGDIGASSLYAQYDDYKSFALDFGYRRYFQPPNRDIRLFGEGTMGVGIIRAIGVHFAAPGANLVFPATNYYDRTAAFTIGFNFGALFKFSDRVDFTGQVGLRHTSGLQTVSLAL
jgi:hypothetical protein